MCERGGDLSLFESPKSLNENKTTRNATDLVKISFERNLTFVRNGFVPTRSNGFFQPRSNGHSERTESAPPTRDIKCLSFGQPR